MFRCRSLDWTFVSISSDACIKTKRKHTIIPINISSLRISCSFMVLHVVRKPLRKTSCWSRTLDSAGLICLARKCKKSRPIIAKHLCSSSTVSHTVVFFSILLVDARRNSRAGLFSISDKVIKFLKVWSLSISILGVFPCTRHCSLKLSWFLTFCQ